MGGGHGRRHVDVGLEPAIAQTSVANTGTNTDAPALEEIVITGTRIISDGYNEPTPVALATSEELHPHAPDQRQLVVRSSCRRGCRKSPTIGLQRGRRSLNSARLPSHDICGGRGDIGIG